MPRVRSKFRNPHRSTGEPGGPYTDAIRIFLEAALEIVEAAEIERVPARKISTWLFSLGAIDALAERLELKPRPALALADAVFEDFYGLDPVQAATVVGRLNELAGDGRWRTTRDAGCQAMGDWLEGQGENAHHRLRELLRVPASADAARIASKLTGIESVPLREPAPRAPRQRAAGTRQRAASSLATTR